MYEENEKKCIIICNKEEKEKRKNAVKFWQFQT